MPVWVVLRWVLLMRYGSGWGRGTGGCRVRRGRGRRWPARRRGCGRPLVVRRDRLARFGVVWIERYCRRPALRSRSCGSGGTRRRPRSRGMRGHGGAGVVCRPVLSAAVDAESAQAPRRCGTAVEAGETGERFGGTGEC